MTMPSGGRDTETRLIAALTDAARRNLSDATPLPPFQPNSSPSRPVAPTGSWALAVVAAAMVIGVVVALAVPNHGKRRVPPANNDGPGTFVTLQAHSPISAADLAEARRVISDRAAALGAPQADVRIVGSDEITAFLPGVPAHDLSDLATFGAMQLRPLVLVPPSPGPVPTKRSSGLPRTVDPWRSLGFPPPKSAGDYYALSRPRQRAVQAAVDKWNCNDLSPDRADAPMVACDTDRNYRYLLGPVIVPRNEIESAAAVANLQAIAYHWQLALKLTPAASGRLAGYLGQLGDWVDKAHPPEYTASILDIADVMDGVVIADATITKPLAESTFAADNLQHYDQLWITQMADFLNAGPLPAPFDVVTMRSR